MELSRYLKIYPYPESASHVILFSTKQASKVKLHRETLAELKKEISPDHERLLAPLGMITPNRGREIREMTNFFESRIKNNKALEFTIVLNLDCNFACTYCFESHVKNRAYMSVAVGKRLIAYIAARLKQSDKNLLVDFYGGEPMLSLSLMEEMALHLKALTDSLGRTFSFRIITNGALFTRAAGERLVPLGLAGVKITLDGPPENHNRFRPFKSGAGSFDVIFKNILATWDLTPIEIGGNYSRTNYISFVELLDIFEQSGLTPEKLHAVKFDPIFQPASAPKTDMGCKTLNAPWIAEADQHLRGEILKRSFYTPKPGPFCCMIENPHALVVSHNGAFYKCPCFIGEKAFCVGHMDHGIADYRKQYGLDEWKNQACLDCVYLPLCFGGCRHMAFVETGKINALACKKEYLDASLETLVMQDIMGRGIT